MMQKSFFSFLIISGALLLSQAGFSSYAYQQDNSTTSSEIIVDTNKSRLNNSASTTVSSIDELKTAIEDGTSNITLQSGTYTLTAAIPLKSNVTIDLNGSTLKSSTSSIFTTITQSVGGYDANQNIIIKNGTLVREGTIGVNLMTLGHANTVTIENVTFSNAHDGHMLELGACKNVTIKNCTFKDGNYSNSNDDGEYEALTFDVAHSGNFAIGPFDDYACENITVTGCTFSNVRRAVGAHRLVSGHLFTNININNCTFSNITGTAIECIGFKDSTIDNNTLNNVFFGIDFMPPSKNIISSPGSYNANNTISNNRITITQSSGKNPCGIRITGINTTMLSGFNVSDNTVSGVYSYAVHAKYINASKIEMVTSTNPKINGIRVENCDAVTVVGSTISKSKSHGLALINSKNDVVDGNTINNSKAHGIYLQNAKNETLTNNTIIKAKKQGINLNKKSSCLLVGGNTIKRCKSNGINLEDKKSKITTTYANKITKPGQKTIAGKGKFFAVSNSIINLKKGKSVTIATFGMSGKVKYSSEDPSIATVNSSGSVKGVSSGVTTIIAKRGKFYAKVKVTVK